ncbi:heterokaryon incompatibility protein-domain-containing protein [Nemania sp. FL0031]|nr:heterokaryon incompatibility protein-domain-containing protein [Nemania sp. FL0031]
MTDDETIRSYEYNEDGYRRCLEYKYSVLSHPDSIRVFDLAPSSDSTAPIQGEIVELRLSDVCTETGYTALSYVWGANEIRHRIQVGDSQLGVRPNLISALYDLRREDRNIRLWVDALCINQNDVNERNHQVQQMRRIYSSSLETIIYLGNRHDESEQVNWSLLERYATRAMNKNEVELAPVFLYEVLSRPWFQRLWVLQEAIASPTLSIQSGHRRMSWDGFCKALILTCRYKKLYHVGICRANEIDQIEIIINIFQARCSYQSLHGLGHLLPSWPSQAQRPKDETLHILDLLRRTRLHQASDPRDKIYGLLGIASGIDVNDQGFAVNYSQDCRDVYTRFARNLILSSQSYDLLSHVDHSPFRYKDVMSNRFQLPSWVPDWDLGVSLNNPLFDTPTILSTLDPETDMEKSERHQSFHRVCACIDSGETLVACGSVIGEIKGLSDVVRLNWTNEKRLQEIQDSDLPESQRRQRIMEVWRKYFPVPYLETPDPLLGVLRRDLFGDFYTTPSEFAPFLDMCWGSMRDASCAEQGPRKGTVEHHLLARSRKTSTWSSKPNIIRVDRTSIVDGKRPAVYSPSGAPDVYALALVPGRTQEGDFLVDLRYGRVPFVLRMNKKDASDRDEAPDVALRDCEFVGESVANRVVVDESVLLERIFVIR